MVIICRDIWCFMLALVYLENLMGDIQYKMWFSIRVRGGTLCTPSVFFCTPPLFNSSLCSWSEIVSFVRKYKHLAEMVIICRDIGCFMLALFYIENLMGNFQYKIWFSIRVRGGTPTLSVFLYTSSFQFFSGVELKLCLLSENVNILLKW